MVDVEEGLDKSSLPFRGPYRPDQQRDLEHVVLVEHFPAARPVLRAPGRTAAMPPPLPLPRLCIWMDGSLDVPARHRHGAGEAGDAAAAFASGFKSCPLDRRLGARSRRLASIFLNLARAFVSVKLHRYRFNVATPSQIILSGGHHNPGESTGRSGPPVRDAAQPQPP